MTEPVWQPSASLTTLKARADLLATIRQFFSARNILEVDTPLLAKYSVTDPYMEVLTADNPIGERDRYFLQTSPEYAMKRLLASGSGPIYQLCKAFRRGEAGGRHNPEFTMLEWYRPGFDHHQLMDEIEELVSQVLTSHKPFGRISYRDLFLDAFAIDPHTSDCETVRAIARQHLDIQMTSDQKDDWLNLLLAEIIEPGLGVDTPVFIIDYPASQSALARVDVDKNGIEVAQRFELYSQGVELANGYFELIDVYEQKQRFEKDHQLRQKLSAPDIEADQFLLAAMEQGLPSCAGVALGVDRLLMLNRKLATIGETISFSVDRA